MAVVAVLSQTPGRGWRWRTEDTGVVIDQGAAYFSTSALAEDDAERALGTSWPGSATDDFDTVSDAEAEDWHYVGEAGEPAFNSTWANISTQPKLAFRLREAGIVDIQGTITEGASGASGLAIFTLPVGYRPSVVSYVPIVATTVISEYEGCYLIVAADGTVTPYYSLTGAQILIYAQIFLTTPDVA